MVNSCWIAGLRCFFLSSLLVPSLPFPSLPFSSLLFSSLLFSSLLFSSLLPCSSSSLFRSHLSPQPQQVTLVSHLPVSRLAELTAQLRQEGGGARVALTGGCRSWRSLASVCVLVSNEEEKRVRRRDEARGESEPI